MLKPCVYSAPPMPDQEIALFLDIDGTLAPLAPTPQEASITGENLAILRMLRQYTGDAIALISGRNLADIDRISQDTFAAAGQHGLEIRVGKNNPIEIAAYNSDTMLHIAHEAQKLAQQYPMLIVEEKGLSVAVHYRRAPELGQIVEAALNELEARYAGEVYLQLGKMVAELRIVGGGKGRAIERLMQLPPFNKKIPIFAGDDLTDEEGFVAVNALGGISIKIGEGKTIAHYRIESVEHFTTWLRCLALHIQPVGAAA